jgi:flagella basal body P-ring formation protein FlgA
MAQTGQQALQDWQSVDAMTQPIARALGREAAPIDRRIKLAQCPERPEITAMNANSLAVRCPSLGWRLRVAMLGGNNRAEDTDFTAAPAVPHPRQRSDPPTIKRGDMVRVSIDTASFNVSYPATATQDGRIGEAIALRGADPKNTIIAVVSGPGKANIPPK